METKTSNPTIVQQVLAGAFDDVLEQLYKATKRRKEYLREDALDDVMFVGGRVKFAAHVRPKYLVGQLATITKINRTTVVVEFDQPNGRFGKICRVSIDLLEPAEKN